MRGSRGGIESEHPTPWKIISSIGFYRNKHLDPQKSSTPTQSWKTMEPLTLWKTIFPLNKPLHLHCKTVKYIILKESEYDQEIKRSNIADQPTAP